MSRHIQIRSFVLGGNHGQYLQAAGLAHITSQLNPGARVTHARYANHVWPEIKVQTKSLLLPKYLAMRIHWERKLSFSPLDSPANIRLYGADQIWSFSNAFFPPDPVFFGAGDTSRKIAYAPSMGHVPDDFTFPNWAAEKLAEFSAIGARDVATAGAVQKALGHTPEIVVDPAMFLSGLIPKPPERHNEIAVYCPRARKNLGHLLNAAGDAVADWPIHLYGYVPRRKAVALVGQQLLMPETVIARIARARLLYTSTFHGVIMALLTGTPFIALSSPSLADRLNSPLGRTTFGQHRLVNEERFKSLSRADMESMLDPADIDCAAISTLVADSRDWLSQALAMEAA